MVWQLIALIAFAGLVPARERKLQGFIVLCMRVFNRQAVFKLLPQLSRERTSRLESWSE